MVKRITLLFGVLACGASVWGQSAQMTMNEEPHYQRLTYVRNMRVFEVNVPVGESTLDHAHDHDVADVALGDVTSRVRRAGEDWSPVRTRASGSTEITAYTGAPAVHRAENAGPTPYRMVVVENLRDRGWSTPAPIAAPGTTLRQDARSFAVYDVRLNAATPRTNHVHENATLVILVSGAVEVQGGGGESEFRMEQTGRWFPSSGSEQPHTLARVGTGEAHVVCVEAR